MAMNQGNRRVEKPIEVAVIGGGCGGMTAALELSHPKHAGRYAVTVYQTGWRLGGKGASGRGPSGRIEEHGLHVWLGFYDNAFRMMRACYDELAATGPSPHGDWRDAFVPQSVMGLFSPTEQRGWQKWIGHFPPRPGLPGDPRTLGETHSLTGYIVKAIRLLRALVLESDVIRRDGATGAARESPGIWPPDPAILTDRDRLLSAARSLLGRGVFTGAAAIAEALGVLGTAIGLVPAPFDIAFLQLAERVSSGLRGWLETNMLADDHHRHVWEVMDLVLAILVGTVRFGLLTNREGLDAIEQYECREWLRMNGASERSLQSPFVRGLYDLALAYEDGDRNKPRLAAGQALRGAMRMFFGYRGALYWRMRSGMGDVVFAPIYEMLRRRGVRFNFFHRLTNVGLPPGGEIQLGEQSHVASLTFDVQAETHDGREYEPLVEVMGRPCWPSHPPWAQLKGGDEGHDFESHWDQHRVGTETLHVTRDFDFVVLAVGIGAIPTVCSEIVARDARWRRMTQEVKTVASQAFQIWLNRDLASLGWQSPPEIVSAFLSPFDTWCDMAHVVPEEAWQTPPATSVYFCGVLPDPPNPPSPHDRTYPARRRQDVHDRAVAYLANTVRHLWPNAYDPDGEFRWDLLADASGNPSMSAGSERFSTQYWRANVNPSDRYVLNVPGSSRHRMSPLDNTYDNLTIAGDWTNCGFNEGCVEAAVMSGLLAAHALSGLPALEDIDGYDHP
jgi:uncharacterized protein with NAD-binding domain and iron-sulfur cluster